MMTVEQAQTVKSVFIRFNGNEFQDWTSFDETMVHLSWLSDEQLVIETQVIMEGHMNSDARCVTNHDSEQCFVPTILEAVSFIVNDYSAIEEKKRLAKKARYVLEYYMALAQTGEIITG